MFYSQTPRRPDGPYHAARRHRQRVRIFRLIYSAHEKVTIERREQGDTFWEDEYRRSAAVSEWRAPKTTTSVHVVVRARDSHHVVAPERGQL